MEKLRHEIRDLIYKRAYQERRVMLASGRESNFYIDCNQVLLTAEGIYKIAFYILRLIEKEKMGVKAVGGPAMGAVPLAAAISALSCQPPFQNPLSSFYVRTAAKTHGTGKVMEGPLLEEGTPVLLLDDVLTSGGSLLKAVYALHQEGCVIEKTLVIVDRQEGGAENLQKEGVSVSSILQKNDLL